MRIKPKLQWYDQVSYVPILFLFKPPVENLELFHAPEAFIHLAWSGLPNYNSLHHIEENAFSNYYFWKADTWWIKEPDSNSELARIWNERRMLNEEMDVHPTTVYAVGKIL